MKTTNPMWLSIGLLLCTTCAAEDTASIEHTDQPQRTVPQNCTKLPDGTVVPAQLEVLEQSDAFAPNEVIIFDYRAPEYLDPRARWQQSYVRFYSRGLLDVYDVETEYGTVTREETISENLVTRITAVYCSGETITAKQDIPANTIHFEDTYIAEFDDEIQTPAYWLLEWNWSSPEQIQERWLIQLPTMQDYTPQYVFGDIGRPNEVHWSPIENSARINILIRNLETGHADWLESGRKDDGIALHDLSYPGEFIIEVTRSKSHALDIPMDVYSTVFEITERVVPYVYIDGQHARVQ